MQIRLCSVPRKFNLWYTRSSEDESTGIIPPVNLFERFFKRCKHTHHVKIGWIDHTVGAGWMSDSYVADICKNCGKTIQKTRTY